ncbi:MAG: hypothetical protein KJO91_12850, partial [Gammaproteobacteria bacterium]|nr:hypothetical protein [Gammaproteobacteria bacterium]
MKKLTILSASALMIAATGAYAHHPAADIIDPDVYAMIEENISDVHLAMTFDDMGGDTTDVGGSMQSRDTDVGNMGDAMGGDVADVGAEIGGNMEDI